MKFLILGDTHGNTGAAVKAVEWGADRDVKHIIQVGDFGLWDHHRDGVSFLDMLNESLRKRGSKMYVVGGNHENWDRWNWYVENNPKDYFGFTMLRTHIRIAPKVHYFAIQGKRCLIVGGAVSIDKAYRTPGRSWWAGETLTDEEMDRVEKGRKVDYLFTHDCSNRTPFHGRLKPDFDSQVHRQKIDTVLQRANPDFHFHGHMHTKYDWMNMTGDVDGELHYAQTYGLECDGDWDNMGILDWDTGSFKFRSTVVEDDRFSALL